MTIQPACHWFCSPKYMYIKDMDPPSPYNISRSTPGDMTTQRTCHWLNDLLLFSWFVVPQQDYASIKHLYKIQYKTVKITACTCAYYSWPFNINAQYIDAIFMKPWSWKFVVSNWYYEINYHKWKVFFFHEIHIATALRSAYNKTKERPSYSFNIITTKYGSGNKIWTLPMTGYGVRDCWAYFKKRPLGI